MRLHKDIIHMCGRNFKSGKQRGAMKGGMGEREHITPSICRLRAGRAERKEKPAKSPPLPSPPAKCARGGGCVAYRRKRTHKRENAKITRFLTAICKKARSAMFLRRKGENAPRISLSRSASPFSRSAPDFSTRMEKILRNFPSPLFACKSILHFVRCENNILPSVLKREFL